MAAMRYRDGTEVCEGDVVLVHHGQTDDRGVVIKVVLAGTEDATDWSLPTGGVLIESGGLGLFTTAHLDQDEDIDFVSRGVSPRSKPDFGMDDLVGKHVLVGITFESSDGSETGRRQLHGTVVSARPGVGVLLALKGEADGQSYNLPPDLRAFRRAAPGEYRLRATGEVVSNPDFLATWTVVAPDAGQGPTTLSRRG
jgi:hypothetical protein